MSNAAPPSAGGAASSAPAASSAAATTTMSSQNLNQIVTDYLLKRGFTRTETIFRQESRHLGPDGRPIQESVADQGPRRYLKAFSLLKDWIDNNLEIYKFELSKLLWPMFVYSWLDLVLLNYQEESKQLFATLRPQFEQVHADDLKIFSTIALPEHALENRTIKQYRGNKYRIPLNQHVAGDLFHFLESRSDAGGAVVRHILERFCLVNSIVRGPINTFSFEAIYRRSQNVELDEADALEGIPGVFTGLSNRQFLSSDGSLRLGPLPMEADLREDVRIELADEDQRKPPTDGQPSLVDEFDRKIKREEESDTPGRLNLPLPQSRARDVVMEMQKVRENRNRFKIESRTGGVGGIPISVCLFTFHNTLNSASCMDFSNDHKLVAIGTMDSYIRVWSLDGKPLTAALTQERDVKVNNRKLIGHSGPVYSVAFSDAIANSSPRLFGDEERQSTAVQTNARLLLSCSADATIRLWSLEVWQCLCIYRGHDGPVFRTIWGPHGHYFLSGGSDKTMRLWMQDHASAQRLFVGHDTAISAIAWHPNGIYVFSASDETDKSIRMWSILTGECLRVFTGHVDYISAMACAPNGTILASADNSGNIMFWDLIKGTRIKRSRGHQKGGIWSLSFSVESNVLVSGGQDGTVRLWDVELPADGAKAAALLQAQLGTQPGTDGADGASATVLGDAARGPVTAVVAPAVASTGKKRGKDMMITPDQISAFSSKKTPIMKVQCTRMNLVVAGGCYCPDR